MARPRLSRHEGVPARRVDHGADRGRLRELRADVQSELERQVVAGDGIEPNLLGVLSTTGVRQQTYANGPVETVRRAMGALQEAGYQVTGAVFNPADDMALDLAQDSQQRYYRQRPVRRYRTGDDLGRATCRVRTDVRRTGSRRRPDHHVRVDA